MKYATSNRYGCIAALVSLSFVLHAKPNNNTNAFTKSLSFIENKGQIVDQYGKHRNDIDYKLDGGNVTMFVGDAQLHYQWYRSNKKEKSKKEKSGLQGDDKSPSGDLGGDIHRMDVVLLGANKNAEIVKEDLQEDYENYYLPQCPDGVTAHRYSKITYKNIYPNIDWEIETAPKGEALNQGCKYNFIVRPGGDYRNIKIQYNGATSIALKDGALVASTPMGSITENVPYTYDAATHKEIKSNFILNNNILSYHIALPSGSGEGDRASAFIIDPVLKWATYYGGSGDDAATYVSVDTAGNAYMCGATNSTGNVIASGSAYQGSFGGGTWDGFIVKFDATGARQWATYFGGTGEDVFNTAETDKQENVYCGGYSTTVSGIAGGTPIYQIAMNGTDDAILVKFNAATGARIWATYYGGTNSEEIDAIACDDAGNIYIGGNTASNNFMTSAGAFQTTPGAGFIAKFNSSMVRSWGTYYNGDVMGIACYLNNDIYISGSTGVATGIASVGAYKTTLGGLQDCFVARFSAAGSRIWGTYYGGPQGDDHGDVATDGQGNVFLTGITVSTTGIATAGSYQSALASSFPDAFLVKFNNAGMPQWGTYYGGPATDLGSHVITDPRGNIYISGYTSSSSGIASPGGYQTLFGGNYDLFIAEFNTAGNRLWATYYGGPGYDQYAINGASDRGLGYGKGRLYLGGSTGSTTGISTIPSYQSALGGGSSSSPVKDAFLVLFDADTLVYIQQPFYDTLLCAGDSLHVPYGVTQTFRSGNAFKLQLSNAVGSFASPTTLATVTGSTAGIFHAVVPSVSGTGYRLRVLATAPADTSTDNGIDIKINAYPTTPVATANTPLCAGQTLNLSSSNSSTGVVWSWIGPNSFTATTQNASIPNVQTNGTGDYIVTANLNGCKRKDTVSVTVNPSPAKPNATSNSPICSGQTLNLFATSSTGGVSWNWVGPGGFNTSAQNPTIPNAQTSNAGSYVVTATLGSCSSSDTEVVVINQGPAVNVYPSPNDTICQGGSVTLVALPVSAGTGPSFQWYKNSNPIGGATNTSYSTTPNNGDVFYCRMTPGTGTSCTGAINSNSITMTVLPVTTPGVSISGPAGAQNPFNLLTFHATGTGGGSSPTYQWLRSGQLVQGAIADTWSTQGVYLSQHDTICVILTSSDICAVPKSDTACMVVNILTGVDDVNKNTTIQLYPNPNDGRFTIDAKGISNKEVTIEITNAVGQTVYTQKLNTTKGLLHETISTNNLSSGIYLLKLHDGDAVVTLRLVVSR